MRPRSTIAFALCSLALLGCLGSQSKAAKLQDAAQNMNIAARFGRMDIASEMIADKSLGDFNRKHMAWGREVRVIDIEFQGVQLVNKDEATVTIAVGWQRPTEQELRVTQVTQNWQYGAKGWKLVDESRAAGDVGLLGEKIDVMRPEQRADVHFKSVTIPSPY